MSTETATAVLLRVSYAKELLAKGIGEAAVRSALLNLLVEHTFHALTGTGFGVLHLKTEGDAVIAIGAFKEDAEESFVASAAECAYGDLWARKLRQLQQKKGLMESSLALRITLARGDVTWESQLRDMLGSTVTALFLTENNVKALLKSAGASVALLGEWDPAKINSLTIGDPVAVAHDKVPASMAVRTVKRIATAGAPALPAPSKT